MIEIDRDPADPRALRRVEVTEPIIHLEVRPIPGAGLQIAYTTADGTRRTLDAFPSVQNAPEWFQTALDDLGRRLTVRLEDGGTRTAEKPVSDLGDVTACPTPRRISLVPDLALGDS